MPVCRWKDKYAKVSPMESMRMFWVLLVWKEAASASGLTVCRLPQQSAWWKVNSALLEHGKVCRTLLLSGEKGGPSAPQMVDSWFLCVWTKESVPMFRIDFPSNLLPLISNLSFNAKPPTYESCDSYRPANFFRNLHRPWTLLIFHAILHTGELLLLILKKGRIL